MAINRRATTKVKSTKKTKKALGSGKLILAKQKEARIVARRRAAQKKKK